MITEFLFVRVNFSDPTARSKEHCAICLQHPEVTQVGGGQNTKSLLKHIIPFVTAEQEGTPCTSLSPLAAPRAQAQHGCELNRLGAHSESRLVQAGVGKSSVEVSKSICWGRAGYPSSEPGWRQGSSTFLLPALRGLRNLKQLLGCNCLAFKVSHEKAFPVFCLSDAALYNNPA